jgi:hypothetical protein
MEGLSVGAGSNVRADGKVEQKANSLVCIPEGVEARTIKQLYLDKMSGVLALHPGDADLPAVSTVAAVLMRAYPCP